MSDEKLQWHPAFFAALHIEFGEELDALEIKREHLLGKKPMQIDVVVVKKEKDVRIEKNIGRLFRGHNIIEYKAPGDYLSINDFYKVYGYTCFYQSDTGKVKEIAPDELTITYVCNHYPREVIQHLQRSRKINAVKKDNGIYYLCGDEFPMQILVTKELPKDENYWLNNLRNDLKTGKEIEELVERYEKVKQKAYYSDVMELIVRANWEKMKEEKSMCEALRELFAEELKESENKGIEKGIEKGFVQAKLETAVNLLDILDIHTIADRVGLPVEKVRELKAASGKCI